LKKEIDMTIQPGKFALALAISAAFLWVICSTLVWISPEMMMSMTENMLHADLANVTWQMTFSGMLIGLVVWAGFAAVIGGLVAGIYNRLAGRSA